MLFQQFRLWIRDWKHRTMDFRELLLLLLPFNVKKRREKSSSTKFPTVFPHFQPRDFSFLLKKCRTIWILVLRWSSHYTWPHLVTKTSSFKREQLGSAVFPLTFNPGEKRNPWGKIKNISTETPPLMKINFQPSKLNPTNHAIPSQSASCSRPRCL